jgi:hypothetical protein
MSRAGEREDDDACFASAFVGAGCRSLTRFECSELRPTTAQTTWNQHNCVLPDPSTIFAIPGS